MFNFSGCAFRKRLKLFLQFWQHFKSQLRVILVRCFRREWRFLKFCKGSDNFNLLEHIRVKKETPRVVVDFSLGEKRCDCERHLASQNQVEFHIWSTGTSRFPYMKWYSKQKLINNLYFSSYLKSLCYIIISSTVWTRNALGIKCIAAFKGFIWSKHSEKRR